MGIEKIAPIWVPRMAALSIAAVMSVGHDPEPIAQASANFSGVPSRKSLQLLARSYRAVADNLRKSLKQSRSQRVREATRETRTSLKQARLLAEDFAYTVAFSDLTEGQKFSLLDRIMAGLRGSMGARRMAKLRTGPTILDCPGTVNLARVLEVLDNTGKTGGWLDRIDHYWNDMQKDKDWPFPPEWTETSEQDFLVDLIAPCLQAMAGVVIGQEQARLEEVNRMLHGEFGQTKSAAQLWAEAIKNATPDAF